LASEADYQMSRTSRTLLAFLTVLFLSPPARAVEVPVCKGAIEPSVKGGCSGISFEGCCDTLGRVLWCEDNNLFCVDCAAKVPYCGWKDQGYYDCGAEEGAKDPLGQHPYGCGACGPLCGDAAACSPACPGSCGTCAKQGSVCLDTGSCYEPQCAGKECGTDPKGFVCGICPAGTECVAEYSLCMPLPKPCVPKSGPGCGGCACQQCVCDKHPNCCTENWDIFCVTSCQVECGFSCDPCPANPTCDGIECGVFCGKDCGGCPAGQVCNAFQCCTPKCSGKVCGPDGCGGVCGKCPVDQVCTPAGACCTQKCAGKQCGDDGCGGVCGKCPATHTCTADGKCECFPDCKGKTCGDDGCGGTCGSCKGDSACNSEGQCVTKSCVGSCGGESPDGCYCDPACQGYGDCCPDVCTACPEICGSTDECEGITYQGCCDQGVLTYCNNGKLATESCPGKSDCGWNAEKKYYDCGTDGGIDPTGQFPKDCPGACVPSCEGKVCGSDGCEGTCGTCPEEQICQAGACVMGTCQGVGAQGCCDLGTLAYCAEGQLVKKDCGQEPACGWSEATGAYACGTAGQPDPSGALPKLCPWVCMPDCTDKQCGPDGCGGSCGACEKGQVCTDTFQCVDSQCGTVTYEGCCDGHDLVWCEGGVLRDLSCTGKGSCGWNETEGYYNCGGGGNEAPEGTFPLICPGGCVPACEEKECGDDGCGWSCGECTGITTCKEGQCVVDSQPEPEPADVVAGDAGQSGDASPLQDAGNVVTSGGSGSCSASGATSGSGSAALLGLVLAALLWVRSGRPRVSPAPVRPFSSRRGTRAVPRWAAMVVAVLAAVALLAGCGDSGKPPEYDAGVEKDRRAVDGESPEALVPDGFRVPDAEVVEVPDALAETVGDVPGDLPDAPLPPDVHSDLADSKPDAPIAPDTTDVQAEADTAPLPYDCNNLPKGPFELVDLPGVIASEDLAFDGKGHLVGSDNSTIYKSTPSGQPHVFIPSFNFRAALRYTPAGNLIVCDNNLGRLVSFDPDGVMTVLMEGLAYPNGITIGMDGFIYFTEHDASRVWRVDPWDGDPTLLSDEIPCSNGLIFSPDYKTLFVGSFCTGFIYSIPIGDDGTPGRTEVWKDMTGFTSGMLDGMGMDACGNLYICVWVDTDVWRISPDGTAERIIDADDSWTYLPNMQWGAGPGWDPYSLYLPDGWNIGAWRVKIGVPSAPVPFP
jgi:sugar lactone lactonase YvrE